MRVHCLVFVCLALACGGGSEANRQGVGAQCANDSGCLPNQHCLTQFKGGYCGVQGCMHDVDCPSGSACVMHTDGMNYCFLLCAQKPDCNSHRDAANEANCSSTAVFVDGTMGRKACVPPNG